MIAGVIAAGVWFGLMAGGPSNVASVTASPSIQREVLRLNVSRPGATFSAGAVGFSIETRELESTWLSAGNRSLVRLMRRLGPSVLRVGGNSVDAAWWTSTGEPRPSWATVTVTPADIVRLRRLLDATGWRVLLGVNLGHFEPSRAADEARVAKRVLGVALVGIEIGNEPNVYSHPSRKVVLRHTGYSTAEYVHEAEAYSRAVSAAAPGVRGYGPEASGTQWLANIGASGSVFAEISSHFYPIGNCSAVPSPDGSSRPTVSELLSPALRQQEDEALSTLVNVGALARRPTRIGETGTGPCGGSSAASPTFASALWSLDWALRAASAGVAGVSFHGHLGLCGASTQSPVCAVTTGPAGVVAPQPEYYGLLAASELEGGRFVPTSWSDSAIPANVTSYATVTREGTLNVAIDNLALAGSPEPVYLQAAGYSVSVKELVASSATATSGVTLRAARLASKGRRALKPSRQRGGLVRLTIRPASAMIVKLRRIHRGR